MNDKSKQTRKFFFNLITYYFFFYFEDFFSENTLQKCQLIFF